MSLSLSLYIYIYIYIYTHNYDSLAVGAEALGRPTGPVGEMLGGPHLRESNSIVEYSIV